MANLFGKNKLREIARTIDTESVMSYIDIVKEWHEDYHIGSLRKDKETSREQEYNHAFFKTILGYKEKPASPFSFEPKATTDAGQLPDAVISHTDSANDIRNIAAVVELKGAGIDLDRPQRRDGNMSPVQQGFKYKVQYQSVPFVIVSNFWEFRLYHDNLLDYEVWTLDDLVNPDDDYLLFKTWYALLKKDSFTTAKGTSKTEAILSDIRIEQENIGKKFYKVYKEARTELLRDIYKYNDYIKTDIDTGIEKAQKIIDRIVFAAFAEDRGLLPDNTLLRVIQAADSSVFGGSLWSTLKGFFEAIDVGSEKLEIPNGYNGGLFRHDEVLNNLQISDEPLRKVVELGTYNFADDLSVNILGHIFEQSISDLEEIKNKVNQSQSLEAIGQSRRKKDGIFYTPDYIVRYIVDNSLGAYLREHEEKFKAEFGLKGDITDKTYEKRERQAYTKYQDFLQGVKVVDPACGSGAFLVYVFDYLLAENKRVGDILGMSLFSTDGYIRDILRNNIYGVDLNEESVEITKLSLWLKTAQKGKKLTTLDNNIRCGNSLIDDENIVGGKAFKWHEQFAEVFKDGGFDVVVGNPPYGVSFSNTEKDYLSKFDTLVSDYEAYIYFISFIKKIVKPNGILSYIFPNTFLTTLYGKKYRSDLFSNYSVLQMVDLSQDSTFADASVRTVILSIRNSNDNYKTDLNTIDKNKNIAKLVSYKKSDLLKNVENLGVLFTRDDNATLLVNKILAASKPLKDYFSVSQGLIPYDKYRGHDEHTIKNRIWHSDTKKDETYKRELKGGDVTQYQIRWNEKLWISYGDWLAAPREPKFFTSPRILVREITDSKLYCAYTEDEFYNTPSLINCVGNDGIDQLSVLAIMNSSLMGWFHHNTSPKANKGLFPKILVNDIRNLPIIIPKDDELAGQSQTIQKLNTQLADSSLRFQSIISSEYNLEKWPAKLNKWWALNFIDFVKILKANLSLAQKDELLGLFNKYRAELSKLDAEIQRTDHEIDLLVYKLYNLTQEEIATIEGSSK
ncbi:MAG: N-6 DNA methylase [Candidatus Saccharimonas sp.]